MTRGRPPLRVDPTVAQERQGVVGNAHENVRGRRAPRLAMPAAADRGCVEDLAKQARPLTVNNDTKSIVPFALTITSTHDKIND